MTKSRIRGEAQTVGELAAILAKLPADMPLYRRGNIGDWVQGVEIGTRKLALHSNHSEKYVADLTNPTWKKAKDLFDAEFQAATIT